MYSLRVYWKARSSKKPWGDCSVYEVPFMAGECLNYTDWLDYAMREIASRRREREYVEAGLIEIAWRAEALIGGKVVCREDGWWKLPRWREKYHRDFWELQTLLEISKPRPGKMGIKPRRYS